MSSRAKLVQTNRSMIVLDKNGMPVNLGHSPSEDYPEQSFPCLVYDAENVLPTALGYKSFFGTSERLFFDPESINLSTLLVQKIIMYQTVNYTNIFIALCEDGIYVNTITEDSGGSNEWTKIVDSTPEEGVRRQWTYCVIRNLLFVYQQGVDRFYGFVDPATYEETDIPSAIEGASIVQQWEEEDWQVGVLEYQPNFINIAAQLGLFKAGNRLGFWDSEGAVAWSSATQIYDFKPSTTTFAGITTFTDVIGTITMIHQHGIGFIIYATKSIVLCQSISGSPEKWAGRAIFNEVGVLFDIQVAVGQPDTVHYAITSGGLCVIENGAPQFIQTEVMDYVKKNNRIYGLSFVDARYLFIHCTQNPDISIPEIIVVVPDSDGIEFNFPKPVYPNPDPAESLIDFLNSANTIAQEEFADHEQIEGTSVEDGKALLPCWTGEGLITNFDETVLDRPRINDTVTINSTREPGLSWSLEVDYFRPLYTAYYFEADKNYIDKAGEEFVKELFDSIDLLRTSKDIVVEGLNNAVNIGLSGFSEDAEIYTGTANAGSYTSIVPIAQLTWNWNDLPYPFNLNGTIGNACSLEIKTELSNVQIKVDAQITELVSRYPSSVEYPGNVVVSGYVPGMMYLFVSGGSDTELYIPGIRGISYPVIGQQEFIPLYPEHLELLSGIFTVASGVLFPPPYDNLRLVSCGQPGGLTTGQREAIATALGYPGQLGSFGYGGTSPTTEEIALMTQILLPKIWLQSVTILAEAIPIAQEPITVFDGEVVGFGYYPSGGFSFRKTHQRSLFKPCDPVRPEIIFNPEDLLDKLTEPKINTNLPGSYIPNPPFDWDYPTSIPLPPNYILLQKGTAAPYYPTFEKAIVYDIQLNKFGMYSDSHKLVYSLFPINRTDQTIVPLNNEGMLAGSLLPDGDCSIFTAINPTSKITYGKLGDYRLGMSAYTKITAQFLGFPSCSLIAEVSLHGETIEPSLSQATTIEANSFFSLPFTLTGKWLNIRLEGTFDLVQLTLESSPASRR